MHQNAQICKLNFKNFLGAMPQTPYHGGATAPLPRPHFPQRSGASRLVRLAWAFGPSISPNQKSWIHPWAHPPSENPGYACAVTSHLYINLCTGSKLINEMITSYCLLHTRFSQPCSPLTCITLISLQPPRCTRTPLLSLLLALKPSPR